MYGRVRPLDGLISVSKEYVRLIMSLFVQVDLVVDRPLFRRSKVAEGGGYTEDTSSVTLMVTFRVGGEIR